MNMSFKNQFDGRVAVVTGGTQGLGLATAKLFGARGAAGIVLCGRNREKGEAVAASLAREYCPTYFARADLAELTDCQHVMAAARERFERVDVLVNAAAVTDRGTIFDTSPELFDRTLNVNLRAPFFLIQEAAKLMRNTKVHGAIVNVLSQAVHGGQPFITAYSAAKGGLATLTKNVAFALMPYRIRVNGLAIGWMNSDGEDRTMRTYHGAKDGWQLEAGKTLPFGRLIEVDEVARAIAYLASEESGLMTGSIVDFDQSVAGTYQSHPPQPDIPDDVY
jgi:NAD(P)-dependent dehydrogenase (short-subunit alcohol dehydrogenase family)